MAKLYFSFAAFLQPRIVLNLFETNNKVVIDSIQNDDQIKIVEKVIGIIRESGSIDFQSISSQIDEKSE